MKLLPDRFSGTRASINSTRSVRAKISWMNCSGILPAMLCLPTNTLSLGLKPTNSDVFLTLRADYVSTPSRDLESDEPIRALGQTPNRLFTRALTTVMSARPCMGALITAITLPIPLIPEAPVLAMAELIRSSTSETVSGCGR